MQKVIDCLCSQRANPPCQRHMPPKLVSFVGRLADEAASAYCLRQQFVQQGEQSRACGVFQLLTPTEAQLTETREEMVALMAVVDSLRGWLCPHCGHLQARIQPPQDLDAMIGAGAGLWASEADVEEFVREVHERRDLGIKAEDEIKRKERAGE